jgi:hypothetical protein
VTKYKVLTDGRKKPIRRKVFSAKQGLMESNNEEEGGEIGFR